METIAPKKTRSNMENKEHFAQLLEIAEVEYQKYLIQKLSISKYDYFN